MREAERGKHSGVCLSTCLFLIIITCRFNLEIEFPESKHDFGVAAAFWNEMIECTRFSLPARSPVLLQYP